MQRAQLAFPFSEAFGRLIGDADGVGLPHYERLSTLAESSSSHSFVSLRLLTATARHGPGEPSLRPTRTVLTFAHAKSRSFALFAEPDCEGFAFHAFRACRMRPIEERAALGNTRDTSSSSRTHGTARPRALTAALQTASVFDSSRLSSALVERSAPSSALRLRLLQARPRGRRPISTGLSDAAAAVWALQDLRAIPTRTYRRAGRSTVCDRFADRTVELRACSTSRLDPSPLPIRYVSPEALPPSSCAQAAIDPPATRARPVRGLPTPEQFRSPSRGAPRGRFTPPKPHQLVPHLHGANRPLARSREATPRTGPHETRSPPRGAQRTQPLAPPS